MSRILVVDDEVVITMQLEERLRSMRFEVVGRASSGEESIDVARHTMPDLVLMDIVMPGQLDGISASEIIKNELDIPVIFLTAYSDDQLIKRAKYAEPYGYIVKPFHESEIKAAIEVALHRKDWERRLRESEEKHRSVVDNANEAIITVGSEGNIVSWNRAAETVFGYSAQEIAGKPVFSIIPERFHKGLQDGMNQLISTGRQAISGTMLEFYGLKKDGSEFPMAFSVSTWKTQRGVSFTGIIRDITKRKLAEEALRQSEQIIRELAKASAQAHEEERQRIALEVHDRLAQTLTAAFYHLQALESLPQADPDLLKALGRVSALLQETISTCRDIMSDLYPPVLADFGIITLIEQELRQFQEDTGCQTRFDADCPVRLPRDVEVTLYRIFHEALANVRRHAISAREVAVSLICRDQVASLQVKNDEPGFNIEAAMQNKSFGGLKSMQRRAEISGGTFELAIITGQGTTVTVRLPYTSAAATEQETTEK